MEALGLIAFRQGRWKEAREYFDVAIALNPRDRFLRWNAFFARAHVRDFPAALRTIDQALAIWPDDTSLIADKVSIYQALGDLDQAGALLSRLRPKPGDPDTDAVEAICDQAMLRRDPGDHFASYVAQSAELFAAVFARLVSRCFRATPAAFRER